MKVAKIFICTYFLLRINEGNSDNKNHHDAWKLVLFNNADSFLLQDNAIFFPFEIIKKSLAFHNLRYILKFKQDTIFSFLAYKTLRAIATLFFSNFFQLFFSDGKFIPSQLYLFIKGLIFVILCGSLFISS